MVDWKLDTIDDEFFARSVHTGRFFRDHNREVLSLGKDKQMAQAWIDARNGIEPLT